MYSPRMRYTGRRVNYFDFYHVEAMSMIGVNDMVNELGFEGLLSYFWKSSRGALSNDVVRPLKTNFDVVNMVATLPRNHHIHVYLEDMAVFYGGNGDNPDNEPPIQVALDTGSELEVQNEPEARDEGYSSTCLDMQGNDSDNSDSDFHKSEYDTEEYDDHVYKGIVDFEIECDMGSGEGCNGG